MQIKVGFFSLGLASLVISFPQIRMPEILTFSFFWVFFSPNKRPMCPLGSLVSPVLPKDPPSLYFPTFNSFFSEIYCLSVTLLEQRPPPSWSCPSEDKGRPPPIPAHPSLKRAPPLPPCLLPFTRSGPLLFSLGPLFFPFFPTPKNSTLVRMGFLLPSLHFHDKSQILCRPKHDLLPKPRCPHTTYFRTNVPLPKPPPSALLSPSSFLFFLTL